MIGVMKDNISKVMERGEKLDDLEEKSGQWWHQLGTGRGRGSLPIPYIKDEKVL